MARNVQGLKRGSFDRSALFTMEMQGRRSLSMKPSCTTLFWRAHTSIVACGVPSSLAWGQSANVVDIRYSMRSRRHRLLLKIPKSSATVFRVAEHVLDPTWSMNM